MFKLFRPGPSTSPCVIYSSTLSSLGQGYALWYPEPHSTGELQVGDVGYIRDGAFVRLFNINGAKTEHKVTAWEPPFAAPQDLPADVFRIDKRKSSLAPGHYRSHGVEMREVGGSVDV